MHRFSAAALFLVLGMALGEAREVMSWVPPYGVAASKSACEGTFNPGRGLSDLGLQFWMPTAGGRLGRSDYTISDDEIAWFRDWGNTNNVRTLLCVYNGEYGWDWGLAQAAINNRSAFVGDLVAAVVEYDLDGVDIDLEATGDASAADRSAFSLMIADLSTALRAIGKRLTVDTYHSPIYNTPNMTWWADWAGKVDNIHSMGYGDLSERSTQTLGDITDYLFRFSWQRDYAMDGGHDSAVASMGLPGDLESWDGYSVTTHLGDAIEQQVSVCIWDMQLSPGWKNDAVWDSLEIIKNLGESPPDTVVDTTGGSVAIRGSALRQNAAAFRIGRGPGEGASLKLDRPGREAELYNARGQLLCRIRAGADGRALLPGTVELQGQSFIRLR